MEKGSGRRSFFKASGLAAASILSFPAVAAIAQEHTMSRHPDKESAHEEEISTNEDLMREHGILKRVLLVYDEIVRRIHVKQEFAPHIVADAATIIRKFIEDYHEKLEEEHIFPRFRKNNELVALVDTLLAQHQAGRRLTDRVLASGGPLKTEDERNRLALDLAAFNRMYAPHEAREDTVLFPALHKIVSSHEYDALGEQFESIERKTFGGDGFDIYLDKVVAIEKQLGIYDLNQFTPHDS
jgi:hemerythrin-like domain-containing protein